MAIATSPPPKRRRPRKLTATHVEAIHRLHDAGLSGEQIARALSDVSQITVSRVLRGVHWVGESPAGERTA